MSLSNRSQLLLQHLITNAPAAPVIILPPPQEIFIALNHLQFGVYSKTQNISI